MENLFDMQVKEKQLKIREKVFIMSKAQDEATDHGNYPGLL